MTNNHTGMTLIVKTVARFTVVLVLIYGIYIVLEGNIGPGGGFAGGVIIALSFVHLMLAFGKEKAIKRVNISKGIFFSGAAGIIFLFFITLSLRKGLNRLTQLSDMSIALMSGMTLLVIFLALVLTAEEREER